MTYIIDTVLGITDWLGSYYGMDIVYSRPEYLYILPIILIIFALYLSYFFWCKTRRLSLTEGSVRPFFTKTFGWCIISFSLVFIVIAAARPSVERAVTYEADPLQIWIMVDRSLSMNARDVTYGGRQISRLEAAQNIMADMISRDIILQDDRIALVDFGFISRLKTPPTVDHGRFLKDVDRLSFPLDLRSDQSIWGTDLSKAVGFTEERIRKWKEHLQVHYGISLSEEIPNILLIIADGENEEGNRDEFISIANLLSDEGIRTYSLGVGSIQGVPWIELLDDRVPGDHYPEEYVEDWSGESTRLETELISFIADITGGRHISFSNLNEEVLLFVDQMFRDNRRYNPVIVEGEEEDRNLSRYPAMIGLVFVVLGIFLLKE